MRKTTEMIEHDFSRPAEKGVIPDLGGPLRKMSLPDPCFVDSDHNQPERIGTRSFRLRPFFRSVAAIIVLLLIGFGCQQRSEDNRDATAVSEEKETPAANLLKRVAALDLQQVDPAVARAIREASDRVQSEAAFAEAWGNLGMTLLAHDLSSPAADCFGVASELDPTEPRWPYFRSNAVRPRDPQQAIALLQTALPLFGDASVVPRLRFADLLLQAGRIEEAETELNAVLRRDRENGRAYYHLGQLSFMKQDYKACLENLQLAQQHGVQRRQGMVLTSEVYRRQGELERADQYRAQAMTLADLGWPDPYYQQVLDLRVGLKTQLVRADLLFGNGKVLESVQLLQQTSQEYPESEWARIYLARGLIRLRRLSEAESALNEALRLAPECAEVYFRMAVVLGLRGDLPSAVDWYRQAIDRKPNMAMAHNNLGHCLLRLNDPTGAEAAFHRSIEVQPDFFEGHAALGTLYQQQGKNDAAKSEFAAALRLRPGHSHILGRLQQLENATDPTSDHISP